MAKNKEFKAAMKAYKKARRKATRPWKGLSWLTGILAGILIAATVVVNLFDNTMVLFLGGSFWKVKNEDPNAIYFEGDFASEEERVERGYELVKQVEGEGAALLTNEDQALPLSRGAKVSLFSTSSVNLVYGGTGSANVDASKADNLKTAMEKAGFEVNGELWDFYLAKENKKYQRANGGTVSMASAATVEMPWEGYTDGVLDSVETYGDAAIVVLSRVGGEGADLEFLKTNYLALDENEKAMMAGLKAMKEEGKIDKIVVLINSSNTLQMDFMKDNEYGVDAVLWIGGVGITGINAVAEILSGEINPSGSLVDTFCYDTYSSPAMKNFVPTVYGGYKKGQIPEKAKTYMIYQEGIYVGYKYYETRYEDFVMGTGNAGEYAYSEDVAFPFGYGLSYTEFAYSDMDYKYNKSTDEFEITVTVTNTGDVAGKETVQIYLSSPYTEYDVEHLVEKASVALVGFDKTEILEPGGSETLTIYVDKRDLASYDTYGAGTYILDEGDYYLTAATDAHDAANNVLAAKGFTPGNTGKRMDGEGNEELVVTWNNKKFDDKTYAVSKTGAEITNRVSDADINLNNSVKESITYLTRNDWEGTMPGEEILKLTLTDALKAGLQDVQYDAADYKKIPMPVLEAENGLKLVDMIGLDYDDPKWEELLDQLTFDEMVSLIGDSFHWTMPLESVQAPGTRDENGPQGLTVTLFGAGLDVETTALTSEDVLAATFNRELVYEMGNIVGNDCLDAGVSILYGPGNNIHRTPYGGRNFEYYSEDGFLSAEISTAEVKAIQEKGVHVVMKHFALNDCEQDRIGLGVWLTEQAAREIYLKAFQTPFEEAGANGVMMAYTRWGTIWSGGHAGLVNGIMREEWGCEGLNISDNVLTTYVNGVDGILAGTSCFDAMLPHVVNQLPEYKDDPVIVAAMKEACHHNLYAIANSVGMNGIGPDTTIRAVTPGVIIAAEIATIAMTVLFMVCVGICLVKKRGFNKITRKPKEIDFESDPDFDPDSDPE